MSSLLQSRVKFTNATKQTGMEEQISNDKGRENLTQNKTFGQKVKQFFSKITSAISSLFKKSEPGTSLSKNTSDSRVILSQKNTRDKLEQTKAFISRSARIGINDSSMESLHETQGSLRHVLDECKTLKQHDFGAHTDKTHEMLTKLEEKINSKLDVTARMISGQSTRSESSNITCDALRTKKQSPEGLSKEDVLSFVQEHKDELKSARLSTLKDLSSLIHETVETPVDLSTMSDADAIGHQLSSLDANITYVATLQEALPNTSMGLISMRDSFQTLKSEIETANAKFDALDHSLSHLSEANDEVTYGTVLTTTCAELSHTLSSLESSKDTPGFPKDRFLNRVKTAVKMKLEEQLDSTKTQLQGDDYNKQEGGSSVGKTAVFNATKSRMLANLSQHTSMTSLFSESDRTQQRMSALENYETNILKLSKSDLDAVMAPKTGEFESALPEMNDIHTVLTDFSHFKGFDMVSSEQKKGMVDVYVVADLRHPDKQEGKQLLLKGLNTIYDYHTDPDHYDAQKAFLTVAGRINDTLNDITRVDSPSTYNQSPLKAIMESSLSSDEKIEARRVGKSSVDDVVFDISKGLEELGRLPKGIAAARRDLEYTTRELTSLYNQSVKDSSHKLNAADFQFNEETVSVLQSKIGGKGLEGILIRAALSQNTLQKMEADLPSSNGTPSPPFIPKNNIQTIYTTLVRGRLDRYKLELETLKDTQSQVSSDPATSSDANTLLEEKNKDIADLEQLKLDLGGLQHCTDLKEFKKLNSTMRTMQASFVADKSDLNNLLMMQSDKQRFALEVLQLKQDNKENRTLFGSMDKTAHKAMRFKAQTTSKNESVKDTIASNEMAINISRQLDKRPGLKQGLLHAIESKRSQLVQQQPSIDADSLKQAIKESLHFKKDGDMTLIQTFTKEVKNEQKQALFNTSIDVLVNQSFETDSTVDHLAITTDFDQDPKTESTHKTFEKIVNYFERKTSGLGVLEKLQVDILTKLVEKGKAAGLDQLRGDDLSRTQQTIVKDTISEMLGDEHYSTFSSDTSSKETMAKKAVYKDMITYLTKQGAMGHTEKWVARLHLNKTGIDTAASLGAQNKGDQIKSMRIQLETLERDTGTTNRKQTTIQGSDIMKLAGVAEKALFNVSLTVDTARSLQLEHEVKKDANGSILIRFDKERSNTTRVDVEGPGAIVTGGVEKSSSAVAGRTFRFDSIDDAARSLVDFYRGDSRTLLGLADGMITESASKSSLALEASLNLKIGGSGLQLDGNSATSIKERVIKDGFTQTVSQQTMITYGGGLKLTDGTGQILTDGEMSLLDAQVTTNVTNEISTPTYNPNVLSGHRVIFEQAIKESKSSSALDQIQKQLCNVLGKEEPLHDLESVFDTQGLDAFAATLEPGDSYEIIQTLNTDAVKVLTPQTADSITKDLKNYTVSLKKVSKDMLNQVTTSYGNTYSKTSDLHRTYTQVLVLNKVDISS